jgi:hypothetical protein
MNAHFRNLNGLEMPKIVIADRGMRTIGERWLWIYHAASPT